MAYYSSSVTYRRPAQRRIGLSAMLAAWRTRQHLKTLDDRALTDIGISRSEADAEANRPIWDVPTSWRD